MSSAFIRSTIEVRHSSFSPLAATALSRIGATSTVCAGAAGALPARCSAQRPPVRARPAPPLAGVARCRGAEDRAHDFSENTHRLLPMNLRSIDVKALNGTSH